ncbi:FecR family protein [bacterium]|nr:FecR family protein [bacterium]
MPTKLLYREKGWVIAAFFISALFLFSPAQVFAEWRASGSCDFAGFTTVSASETFPDEASCRAYAARGDGICREKANAAGYDFLAYTTFTLTEPCRQIGCDAGSWAFNGQCLPADEWCVRTYGPNIHAEGDNCNCDAGYSFVDGRCISLDSWCRDTYGANIHEEGGQCICDDGYSFANGACVTLDSWCRATYGENAVTDGENCNCKAGFVFNDKNVCVPASTVGVQTETKPQERREASEIKKSPPEQKLPEQPTPPPEAAVATAGEIRGKVFILRTDGTREAVSSGAGILPGDKIFTGARSSVLLSLQDGSKIVMSENSTFIAENPDAKKSYIEVVRGKVRFIMKCARRGCRRVYFGNAVAGVRGTDFVVDYSDTDNTGRVYVNEGSVEIRNVKNDQPVATVNANEQVALNTVTVKSGAVEALGGELWGTLTAGDAELLEAIEDSESGTADVILGFAILVGLPAGLIFLIVRRRRKKKKEDAGAQHASFVLKWGNILSLLLMVLFILMSIPDTPDAPATTAVSIGKIGFFAAVLSSLVVSIVRIAKKYHRARAILWLILTPVIALVLLLSAISPSAAG